MTVTVALVLSAQASRAATVTNEYWIDDDGTGTHDGTLQNPYDGSTQTAFDSIMNTLTAQPNVVIHLLPGLYRTVGSSWFLKSNSRLLGSGIDVSTVKLVDDPANVIAVPSAYGATNVEVADMTVDDNGSTSTIKWSDGVVLYGARSAIRRVKVINAIGDGSHGYESFPFLIAASHSDGSVDYGSTGSLIEDCEVSSVLGDYCSGICISGGEGVITKCKVYLPHYTGSEEFQAYNCGSYRRMLIMGNYSEGGTSAFYSDWDTVTNLLILNNIFRKCYQGIVINHQTQPGQADTFKIQNNLIEMNTDLYSSIGGGVKYGIVSYYASEDFVISGNTIRIEDDQAVVSGMRAIGFGGVAGAVINNNVWTRDLPCLFNACTNMVVFNNHDLRGNLLTNVSQVTPACGMPRRTVTSNASITYADKYIGCKNTVSITNTLPSAVGYPGKDFIFVDETGTASGTKEIVLKAATGETINGLATRPIITGYGVLRITSDGANWFQY